MRISKLSKEIKIRQIEKRHARSIDKNVYYNIILCTIFLCVYGLMMVYSASSVQCALSEKYNYDTMYFLKR